jgi:hypothetical protein
MCARVSAVRMDAMGAGGSACCAHVPRTSETQDCMKFLIMQTNAYMHVMLQLQP